MRYILAAFITSITFSTLAQANTKMPVITLGGDLGTQFGYATQKKAFNVNAQGNQFNSWGIVNDTQIKIKADGVTPDFKYGGYILLNTDTSPSKYFENSVAYQTMMYVESPKYGRIEAGDYWSATVPLMANASILAVATGGIAPWADWFFYFNYNVGNGNNIITPSIPTRIDGAYSFNASKITYFTPTIGSKCNNVQVGISYTPDTDQHGTITNLRGLTKSFSSNSYYGGFPARQLFGYTDVVEGGIVYNGKFNNIGIRISVIGEMGEAKKILDAQNSVVTRHDLSVYEIGATIHYDKFGFGGSIGDWGKSGMYKNITNAAGTLHGVANAKSGRFWDIGANYVHGDARASIGYLQSENGGFGATPLFATPSYSPVRAKTQILSIGVDYTLAPGFVPYAEVTFLDIHDKSQVGPLAKNTGSVFLAGTKLHF